MPTLKTLKLLALKAENKYLKAQIKKLSQERKSTSTSLGDMNEAYIELNNEIHNLRSQLNNKEEIITSLNEQSLRFLKAIPLEQILRTDQEYVAFCEACDEGKHIVAIKTLRESTSGLGIGLKAAKDLYETKYRNYTKYPKEPQQS